MSFRYGDVEGVVENRRKFLGKNKIRIDDCVMMEVEHGSRVAVVGGGDRGRGMRNKNFVKGDGMVTKTKGLFLCLLTADCYPVVLVDPVERVVGLVHAGWESADKEVIEKVVSEMEKMGCDSPTLVALLGPGIGKESYKVKNPKQKNDEKWNKFLERVGDDEWQVDLEGFVVDRLVRSGLDRKNIKLFGEDTAKSDNYFSHYRAKRSGESEGRMMTVAVLV